MFQPALGHQLQPDADAEKRLAAPPHALLQRLDHAGNGDEPLLAVGKGADARQHDPLGRAHVLGLGRHFDRERRAALPRRALEGLGGGMEVPRTVIDDGDVHIGSRPAGRAR